jgi:SAM-dependent methyltransferase
MYKCEDPTPFDFQGKEKILDIPCGYGRHSFYLGEKGFDVTGIDLMNGFLNYARENNNSKNVKYIQGDMRKIKYKREFDVVIMLGGSFGFFSDRENERVIEKISNALKSSGYFIMDNLSRDHLFNTYKNQCVNRKNDDFMIDFNNFDYVEGRSYCERVIVRDGQIRKVNFSIRLYNINELKKMSKKYDMIIEDAYGDWSGGNYDKNAKRQIVIMKKR